VQDESEERGGEEMERTQTGRRGALDSQPHYVSEMASIPWRQVLFGHGSASLHKNFLPETSSAAQT
jgi:hypothetical protein